MVARPVVAALLLATVGAGLWWVASSAPSSPAPDQLAEGEFRVIVMNEADVVDDGVVRSLPTPLAALRALGEADNFGVEVEQQTWIGSGCTAEYVVGIAGKRESSTGGWNYYVRSPGGDWEWKSAGAACYVLEDGDEVEWCWVELDACRQHAP